MNDLEEKSEDKGLPGDKEAMFSRRDQETHRNTYFQEAILILDDVKNRFLPIAAPKGKVRKMIYRFYIPSYTIVNNFVFLEKNFLHFIPFRYTFVIAICALHFL